MEIGILDADINHCRDLCALVKKLEFAAVPIHTIERLSEYLSRFDQTAVIMNIDTMAIKNRDIRNLARKHRLTTFLCISENKFHPDFKEAICNHIFAWLKKPIDPDELSFFLNSIKKTQIK